ncbi:MAG: tyrosine phenol-lyase [Candidatus Zixiibacteriota bacterium]|nr:MAG: tyrosine phenol-lyase [candidate division Zixibacteria bacterium]
MSRKRQPIEPHRIKSVEPIKQLSAHEREQRIVEARYNIFRIDAQDIFIDLLTDSGTTAMSARQWAALMIGDESYAGAASFRNFERTVKDIFRKRFVIPCHQGRSAENLMFSTVVEKGKYVLNNTHFDTTRGNTLHKGGIPIDLPCPESTSDEMEPFKGNMDTEHLEAFINEHGAESIAMVVMTVTNNSVGGLPVSMANIHATSEICRRHNILFFFDGARYAENCYFIKRDEPGYGNKSVSDIANEMFECCDGVMMSAKKDGMANIGGFIALNDEDLYQRVTELMIIIEGFPTYGGLAGRDLEVLAVGLREAQDFDYLDFRINQVAYLGEQIKQAGMPIVEPTGGHAVFVDAGKFLPHVPPNEFPGQSVAVEFYREGGIRMSEIGSLMFGGKDPNTGEELIAVRELVRLAMPRRVYTNSHYDYVADVAARIADRRDSLTGYKVVHQTAILRHFTCDLEPLAHKKVHS